MRTALTIAGSDSGGGAGIQADIKTMTAHGVFAMSAVTALTAQNTTGVTGIMEVTPEFLAEQLDAIFTDIFPDAVKTGMVSSAALIEVIAAKLKEYGARNIVVDPVMVATSGAKLISEDAIGTLKSRGGAFKCGCCGFTVIARTDGSFHPAVPFENVAAWDAWQAEALRAGDYEHGSVLFSDEVLSFRRLLEEHQSEKLLPGRMVQRADRLCCGSMSFPLEDIDFMAMVQKRTLLFTVGSEHYEIKCRKGSNLRKYLAVWQNAKE